MDIGKMRTADPIPIFASVLFVVKKPISAAEGAAISSVQTADRRWKVKVMNRKMRRQGKPQGASYADVLARKKLRGRYARRLRMILRFRSSRKSERRGHCGCRLWL